MESDFRVSTAALMMASKFVDEYVSVLRLVQCPFLTLCQSNMYPNKSWSDVSNTPLEEIYDMDHEILLGTDFSLYVGQITYESWLNLLRGLIVVKEKDGNVCKKIPLAGLQHAISQGTHIIE